MSNRSGTPNKALQIEVEGFLLGEKYLRPMVDELRDAVDQAHRLADGYNRQFLRVLRQLRDLRRYAPVVIQNAQQVNVGNQQLNVSG